jgi:mycothiol synthase
LIQQLNHLNPTQQDGVLSLISAATEHDEIPPIGEHIVLHLRHGGDKADRHLIIQENEEIIGYAHIDMTDEVAGSSAELVVHPLHRGHGLGRSLLEEICRITSPRLWSHGDLASAKKLAQDNGLERVRTVIQMRRALTAHLPDLRGDVVLRAFLPGSDDEAWLALNNRIFVGHPEQGGWTLSNLRQRMMEEWFDPDGFLLATKEERLIAFCWTKIHGVHTHSHDGSDAHGHDPIGEIYAMGVDPDFAARGFGSAITIAGLAHLRRQGLYTDLGFSEWGRDVMYRLPN